MFDDINILFIELCFYNASKRIQNTENKIKIVLSIYK